MQTTIKTTLQRLAFGKIASDGNFAAVVRGFAETVGRVKTLETDGGDYTINVNGAPIANEQGRPVVFHIDEGETLVALAFNPSAVPIPYNVETVAAVAENVVESLPFSESWADKSIEQDDDEQDDEIKSDEQETPPIKSAAFGLSAAPLSFGASPTLGAVVGDPKTIYFSNTNASGAGSFRAAILAANAGDTIEPDDELKKRLPFIIDYNYDFPLNEDVSIKSGVIGKKIILDFKGGGGISYTGALVGQTFEDVVFYNVVNNSQSYAIIQFSATASGSASFVRCGFVGWSSSSLPLFRHASTNTRAKMNFDSCVFGKASNHGAVNGWALSGYVVGDCVYNTFANNGLTGYFFNNTAQATTIAGNVCDVSSAAGTLCQLPRNNNPLDFTFAILGSNNEIKDGRETGFDYFGNANDGTIGAISGGIYTDFSTVSKNTGEYIGKIGNVANVDVINCSFTYSRIDRNVRGLLNATKGTNGLGLFKLAAPLDKIDDLPVVLAKNTGYKIDYKVVDENTVLYTVISDYSTHWEIGGEYYWDGFFAITLQGAPCGELKFTSGLDSKTLDVAPTLYYIGNVETVNALNDADWSVVGFSGLATYDISAIEDARGYLFAINKTISFVYPASATNVYNNRFIQYDGAKVSVFKGSTDITSELKTRGLIVDYIAESYFDYVFGDQAVDALAALDLTALGTNEQRVAFFGTVEE